MAAVSRAEVVTGYCAPTKSVYGGDCHAGLSGSWMAKEHGIFSLDGCMARCRLCPQCNFVSFSSLQNDCSWYNDCRQPLQLEHGGLSFETVPVTLSEQALAAWRVGGLHSGAKLPRTRTIAIVLHGMIGSLEYGASVESPFEHPRDRRGNFTLRAKKIQASPALQRQQSLSREALVHFTHRMIRLQLIEPNERTGCRVLLFMHSWNPPLGRLLDSKFKPAWSAHAPPVTTLDRRVQTPISAPDALPNTRPQPGVGPQTSPRGSFP